MNASSTITSTTADTVITIPLRRSKVQEEGIQQIGIEAVHLFYLTHFPFFYFPFSRVPCQHTNTHRDEGDDEGECGSCYPGHDPAEAPSQTAIDGCRSDRHGGTFATTHFILLYYYYHYYYYHHYYYHHHHHQRHSHRLLTFLPCRCSSPSIF